MSLRDKTAGLAASLLAVAVAATSTPAEEPPARPRMRQLESTPSGGAIPSSRDLVDARAVLARRFREPLARADSAAGATAAAAALLDAATDEEDRALKWLMLAEARRLAAAAGDAAGVDRSIKLANAAYEFDAITEEHRLLREIPLLALDPPRAATLAGVAEGLAERAEADGRHRVAADVWMLAVRGWQRAGDAAAARRAAKRLGDAQQAAAQAPRTR